MIEVEGHSLSDSVSSISRAELSLIKHVMNPSPEVKLIAAGIVFALGTATKIKPNEDYLQFMKLLGRSAQMMKRMKEYDPSTMDEERAGYLSNYIKVNNIEGDEVSKKARECSGGMAKMQRWLLTLCEAKKVKA